MLAETFKYLYLLFADPSELLLDLDDFLFTTEAHLLPLTLSRNHNLSVITISDHQMDDLDDLNSEFARCCPNTLNFFPETARKPLKNLVDGVCPRTMRRKLLASQFTAGVCHAEKRSWIFIELLLTLFLFRQRRAFKTFEKHGYHCAVHVGRTGATTSHGVERSIECGRQRGTSFHAGNAGDIPGSKTNV